MGKKGRACIIIMAVCLTALTFSGCAEQKEITMEPDVSQVRSICDLATLECYYHNVAKSVKPAPSGITHLGEKDRNFWIEYTGVARLGIDMTKVEMEVDGNNIKLTIPDAEILGISIDEATLNEDSYIVSEDGINSNKITADDQTKAINSAQQNMKETVKENKALLLNAQSRAQTLIENYFCQLGEAAQVEYQITWDYISEDKSDATEE